MAALSEKKLFVGNRIRRLRRTLKLTQAQMADDLGISPSYLNLLERNQRPLSVRLLLRLAEVFEIDIKDLSSDDESKTVAGLKEILADPLFEGIITNNSELIDLVGASPSTAGAMLTLYRAYREVRADIATMVERMEHGEGEKPQGALRYPIEEVRDYFEDNDNHFPELEGATESLWQDGSFDQHDLYRCLNEHLKNMHDITVRIVPPDILENTIWRYDRHSRRLFISESVDTAGRIFTMAHEIGLLGYRDLLNEIIERSSLQAGDAVQLCRLGLANYFAAALLMPYAHFLSAAEQCHYDIDALCNRFGATFEQVCHRLTTLQRTGARGIPFFFLRIDHAGNVLKRLSASGFHFARFGGICPRWDVHRAFSSPNQILKQVVEIEQGDTYFTFCRTVGSSRSGHHQSEQRRAIGMGCRIEFAHKLVYADGLDLDDKRSVTPIGSNCRLCERSNCTHRAQPPLNRRVSVGEHQHGVSPYSFETVD